MWIDGSVLQLVAGNLAVIWRSKDIGLMTKTRLYKALVLSVLLYNAETWTMTRRDRPEVTCFRDGSPETYSGNQSMGPAEKCRHKKINRDQPGCRQPSTPLWACSPYVAKPHPEHHAIQKSAWEEASGQTKGALAR